jgi:type II restriction/modification system DNA methylase subunit YeeA
VASNEELVRRFHDISASIASSNDFIKVPGSPVAYWVSERVRELFASSPSFSSIANPRQGLATADDGRFLRLWWEVNELQIGREMRNREEARASEKKWFPFNKGGAFRKWYGNNEYTVNWKEDGLLLKNYEKAVIRNPTYYFKSGITWSLISIASASFRAFPTGFIIGHKGPGIFTLNNASEQSVLGFLNSSTVNELLKVMSPTMGFEIGQISKLPVLFKAKESEIVTDLLELARADWDSFETSWDFQNFPFLRADLKVATVEVSFNNWQAHCNANIKRMQELETENNRLFIEAYGLQDELTPEVPEDQITLARADREADIKRLVSYALGCMMGRYSLDKPGLIYAHSGNIDFDPTQYKTIPADPDGIIPAMEAEWFADDAANRFIDFTGVAWPKEHLEDNLIFIADSLGRNRNEQPRDTIRRYIATGFFKDHLKTYKKRPIYWLFSSGKQRAFQCLVYLHRYNEGTLSRMRTEYVIPLQSRVAARIDQLASDTQNATSTSHRRKLEKERDALRKQQGELQAFDEKLRHYADMRISLDLDDGVKVNYGKFGDLLAEVKAVTGGSED